MLLSCTLNLSGSPLNQVPLAEVSVPEIAVLRALHGEDAVHNFTLVDRGSIIGGDEAERERLSDKYGKKVVRDLFQGGPMPKTLPGVEVAVAPVQTVSLDELTPKRGRPAKKVDMGDAGDDPADSVLG